MCILWIMWNMSKQSYYIFSSGELRRNNNSFPLYSDNALKKHWQCFFVLNIDPSILKVAVQFVIHIATLTTALENPRDSRISLLLAKWDMFSVLFIIHCYLNFLVLFFYMKQQAFLYYTVVKNSCLFFLTLIILTITYFVHSQTWSYRMKHI